MHDASHIMRDVMERFVLLPFTAGCICEPSISVVMQNTKRPKRDTNARTAEEEKEEEHEYMNDEESLSGESFKTDPPRFQKLFKNFKTFSQIFVYKDELEPEMGLEIGFPTDVKHVSHIGLDGRASSIFMEECNNVKEAELINRLHSFPLKQLELATPNMRRLLLGTQM